MKSYIGKNATGELIGQIQLVPNPQTVETINHAVSVFGFLICRNETLSIPQFIARITESYDCEENPQNRAMVFALRVLM